MNDFLKFRSKILSNFFKILIETYIKLEKTELLVISNSSNEGRFFAPQQKLENNIQESVVLELQSIFQSLEYQKKVIKYLCFGIYPIFPVEVETKIFTDQFDSSTFDKFVITNEFEELIKTKQWKNCYILLMKLINFNLRNTKTLINILEQGKIVRPENVIEYRQTRLIPRSIPRTIERFIDELQLTAEDRYIQEFKLSREQIWTSFKSLLILICVPIIITKVIKSIIFEPIISYEWNTYNQDFFLNHQQEQTALLEVKNYEEQIYFDQLVLFFNNSEDLIGWSQTDQNVDLEINKLDQKILTIADNYNKQSITILSNIVGDFLNITILLFLFYRLKSEIKIIRSFLGEILYSLNDTVKSFLILLVTDLLVGFHSPKGWEVLLQTTLDHFAIPKNEDFIFLCVATFPVLLDTAFKYWIFRYLNRLSPSTVVTYHNMIE